MHPSTEAILRFFEFDHLPPALMEIARPFNALAHDMADRLDGPELTAGLRKLLEAKDCMVRAAVTAITEETAALNHALNHALADLADPS